MGKFVVENLLKLGYICTQYNLKKSFYFCVFLFEDEVLQKDNIFYLIVLIVK